MRGGGGCGGGVEQGGGKWVENNGESEKRERRALGVAVHGVGVRAPRPPPLPSTIKKKKKNFYNSITAASPATAAVSTRSR